mgnify:CR=1 FL=1
MEPAACVLRGVQRSGLSSDGVALVLGAGSMGLLHVLVLKVCQLEIYPPQFRSNRRHAILGNTFGFTIITVFTDKMIKRVLCQIERSY